MTVHVSGDGFALNTLEDLESTIERHPVWPIAGLHGAHELIERGLPALCVPIVSLVQLADEAESADGASLRRIFRVNDDPEGDSNVRWGALWEARNRTETTEKAELLRLSKKYPGVAS